MADLPPRAELTPPPAAGSPAVAAVMRGNRKTDTRPEVALSALHRKGLRFRRNHLVALGDLSVRPDVVFQRQGVAVFVDGCFWHRCPEHGNIPRSNTGYWASKLEGNVRRDQRVSAALEHAGWEVLRFWEHESPAVAAVAVAEAIGRGSERPTPPGRRRSTRGPGA